VLQDGGVSSEAQGGWRGIMAAKPCVRDEDSKGLTIEDMIWRKE